MSKYLVEESTLTDIADAIREQTGEAGQIQLKEFANKVTSISGGKHTYSTTEQEVGEWIDGSTVYEKSYSGTITATQLTLETFTDEISLISGNGAITKTTGSQMTLGILPNANTWSCGIHFTSNSLKLFTTSEVSNGTYRITVRYTKTQESLLSMNSTERNENEEPTSTEEKEGGEEK